jgi:hypothetical protein
MQLQDRASLKCPDRERWWTLPAAVEPATRMVAPTAHPGLSSHQAMAALSFDGVTRSPTARASRLVIRSALEQMASRVGHNLIARTHQPRVYRLIDDLLEPHPYLDGLYDSIEEAFRDVCEWLESLGPVTDAASNIGLEVQTPDGGWRTIRQPALIACPLACLALSR